MSSIVQTEALPCVQKTPGDVGRSVSSLPLKMSWIFLTHGHIKATAVKFHSCEVLGQYLHNSLHYNAALCDCVCAISTENHVALVEVFLPLKLISLPEQNSFQHVLFQNFICLKTHTNFSSDTCLYQLKKL